MIIYLSNIYFFSENANSSDKGARMAISLTSKV